MRKSSEILKSILKCASEYEKNLIGRNLLFIFVDKHKKVSYLEVEFRAEHYLHFTGVRTGVASKFFYKMCIKRRLSLKDFVISGDGIVDLKLKVLPELMKANISANMVGEYCGNRPVLYTEKLVGNVSACMGFIKYEDGDVYVPNTVLATDMGNEAVSVGRVVLTLRKNCLDEKYDEVVN
ncbi:MAG: PBECR4 domain-containing protein [Acidaminococcaceae bacterium]|nr:PBECR4 domain-containing protein [Acidaminococcaceae bacterium]